MLRLALLHVVLATSLAAAQARASVTVSVPPDADELARELAMELGPEGHVVREGEASESPIDATVAVERRDGQLHVEVRHRSLERPLRSATREDADPRTVAIVAAELIGEADQRFLDALPRLDVGSEVASPAPSPDLPRARPGPDAAPRRHPLERGERETSDGSGLILQAGVGPLLALNRDRTRAGGQLRVVVGHRFDARYRLAGMLEVGVLSDPISSGPHMQPWGRGCVEGAIGSPARPAGVAVGVHLCVVAGGARTQRDLSLRDPAGRDPEHGAFAQIGWASFSAGGYVAVGGPLAEAFHLWARVDVDGTVIGAEGYVVPSLSLLLGTP